MCGAKLDRLAQIFTAQAVQKWVMVSEASVLIGQSLPSVAYLAAMAQLETDMNLGQGRKVQDSGEKAFTKAQVSPGVFHQGRP